MRLLRRRRTRQCGIGLRGVLARVLACVALCAAAYAGVHIALSRGWIGAGVPTTDAANEWCEDEAPDYYRVVGRASFEGLPELDPGTVVYAPLDAWGRSGTVVACVDFPLMEEGRSRERADTSSIHPSGWGTNEAVDIETPTGDVYHGYFWNRSHLLAKSLGGKEIAENLICGTRMQNVGANAHGAEGGMAYVESLARDWLESHPQGFVRYAARPVYVGTELVCRNVIVDALSSDGAIDCEIVVFNAAKGYEINYATGEFWPQT